MTSPDVLLTAASRRVPLVQAFRRALAQLGGGRVIVTDVSPLSPAVYQADRAYRVPLASDAGYIDEILTICQAEHVRLVVPTIDDELPAFGEAAARFAAAGIRVAVSPTATSSLCNDKHATCQVLRHHGIASARSYLPGELPNPAPFPLFIKPRFGRGSVGAFAVRNARELDFFTTYVGPDAVLQEFLAGPEFTIDLLCDFRGRALSIVPRERVHVRAGVIDRGRTCKDPALIALAEACARAIPFHGAVNIQCRVVDGRPVIFEINPRFSGGIPLTIQAGADFPRMLVQLARRVRVVPAIGAFRDGTWMTNYEASVFLDADEIRLDAFGAAPATEAEVA